ncbi:hypothetical protein WJX84_008205, partial [Apatococcus fuscideae]
LLLSCSEYDGKIDLWSVGCIFGELLIRRPLFPGENYLHQLKLILQVVGSPSHAEASFIESVKAKAYVLQMPAFERMNFHEVASEASAEAVDLLSKFLVFNPAHRISIEDALAHPFLASLHDPSDEPTCSGSFSLPYEIESLETPQLKRLFQEEMSEL